MSSSSSKWTKQASWKGHISLFPCHVKSFNNLCDEQIKNDNLEAKKLTGCFCCLYGFSSPFQSVFDEGERCLKFQSVPHSKLLYGFRRIVIWHINGLFDTSMVCFWVIFKLDRPSPHSLLLYYNKNSRYASSEKRRSNGFKIQNLVYNDRFFIFEWIIPLCSSFLPTQLVKTQCCCF